MRPPMQTNALQQHEFNRQHHQQQQQQQVHQLQTQIGTASTLTPAPAGTPLAPVVIETTHTRQQQQNHQSKLQPRDLFVDHHSNLALAGTTTVDAPSLLEPQQEKHRKQLESFDENQLLELSQRELHAKKLPPPPPPARRIATAATNATAQQTHSINNGEATKRYSLSSQYSRSSSSDDASSSSLSCNSRANTYDDAAEHFIINFPADSPEIHQRFQHTTDTSGLFNLPLSETEPLLTNIEATVKDTKRSICLNKTSGASLVFTKKELHTTPQHNANNNQRRATLATATPQSWQTRSWKTTSLSLTSTGQQKKTKHLPATYNRQQPQRRSLQLNYNNNLVTTTACGGANNNYYCGSAGLECDQHHHYSIATGKCNRGGGGKVVLHKQHTGQNTGSGNTATVFGAGASNTKTAATTRKQHAYSWYAPVYSALEEELEQDSRDSSPIHNLAQTKQKLNTINHYQQRAAFKPSSLSQTENETVALLETRNQINIQQAQLGAHDKRDSSSQSQTPAQQQPQQQQQQRRKSSTQSGNKQKEQKLQNGVGGGGGNNRGSSDLGQLPTNIDDGGPLAGSLGLSRGPIPPRKRLQNIVKSWVGLKSNSTTTTLSATTGAAQTNNNSSSVGNISTTAAMVAAPTAPPNTLALSLPHRPTSPEITITRTPSEQNLVILREPAARCVRNKKSQLHSNDKLAYLSTQAAHEGSTSSLNVVQQKLWNIVRREHSATSLHQEKSQSIVQYTAGMRKCETVLALTRQAASPTNATMCNSNDYQRSTSSMHYTGSGIFNANGIEQIRPLNRVRNSVTSINGAGGGNATAATCSRCSSLLSLAATGSRCSLNFNKHFEHGLGASASQQQLQQLQYIPAKVGKQQRDAANENQGQQQTRHSSIVSNNSSNICFSAYTRLDSEEQTPPPSMRTAKPRISLTSTGTDMGKIQVGGKNYFSNTNSPSNVKTTATILYAKAKPMSTPTTPSIQTPAPTPTQTSTINNFAECLTQQLANAASKAKDYPLSASTTILKVPTTPSAAATLLNQDSVDGTLAANNVCAADDTTAETSVMLATNNNGDDDGVIEMHPFEPFTCKLCLIDVDTAPEATTLQECGCRFCTECMKAYVEFEISEAAYEISCPDAQCPTQGIMTLAEIATLTTANLMKKHHRYRLNKEIELDKSRTWCPRAGCETICHIGPHHQSDATPSTSTHKAAIVNSNGRADSASPITATIAALNNKGTVLWAVQCPTCKDEFCSACKKAWHPNISCEEHSRRLVADGHDDIGIPFDNDLIKCCPMCAVPIEKDEGCAQMMCKRCKHVFCWYCLASLDDDFLLRHYDKGPCKNKLGHSRASVVWHRAQVIGIFAGFGILLLVASPLLLLAAPCIICCKCRSCSGSKIDDGDDELDEATALQSS